MLERRTCQNCFKEFTSIRGETWCAVCSDPKGFEIFCKGLEKEIRLRDRHIERAAKQKLQDGS